MKNLMESKKDWENNLVGITVGKSAGLSPFLGGKIIDALNAGKLSCMSTVRLPGFGELYGIVKCKV